MLKPSIWRCQSELQAGLDPGMWHPLMHCEQCVFMTRCLFRPSDFTASQPNSMSPTALCRFLHYGLCVLAEVKQGR